jgi:hypothetical protein
MERRAIAFSLALTFLENDAFGASHCIGQLLLVKWLFMNLDRLFFDFFQWCVVIDEHFSELVKVQVVVRIQIVLAHVLLHLIFRDEVALLLECNLHVLHRD